MLATAIVVAGASAATAFDAGRAGYDLDGNGTVDLRDASLLADIVESLALPGGLASYGATAAHGPFVHLDLRGYRARW